MSRIADLGLAASGRLVSVPTAVAVPEGFMMDLPGRGRTYVVDTGPPVAAGPSAGGTAIRPTIILLHALACTGLLTWYPTLPVLRERYRVVTFDQRWHGQGIFTDRFSLDDCADDVIAVADGLGLDRFIVAGYSMGSLVAQLVWRRHPQRPAGVVMCASTTRFVRSEREPAALRIVGDRMARAALRASPTGRVTGPWLPGDRTTDNRWALEQFRSTTGRRAAAAAAEISRFDSSGWIGSMNVPAAVVVTARDRLIPADRQRELARRIRGTAVYDVDAGHAACV
ncbi:MAG: alpha/beta hydrolase, partial [Actinomycetota bacterium]|nr:alpha/beta hydrolase [Actinomycetota bacterium]